MSPPKKRLSASRRPNPPLSFSLNDFCRSTPILLPVAAPPVDVEEAPRVVSEYHTRIQALNQSRISATCRSVPGLLVRRMLPPVSDRRKHAPLQGLIFETRERDGRLFQGSGLLNVPEAAAACDTRGLCEKRGGPSWPFPSSMKTETRSLHTRIGTSYLHKNGAVECFSSTSAHSLRSWAAELVGSGQVRLRSWAPRLAWPLSAARWKCVESLRETARTPVVTTSMIL